MNKPYINKGKKIISETVIILRCVANQNNRMYTLLVIVQVSY